MKIVRVTFTVDYTLPPHDTEQHLEEWFRNPRYPMDGYHAYRDGSEIGNSTKVHRYEILDLSQVNDFKGSPSSREALFEDQLLEAKEEIKEWVKDYSAAKMLISHAHQTIQELHVERDRYRAALEKIAKPSSCETDGSETKEEYEALYDFWHEASSSKLKLAQEALETPGAVLT